MLVINIRCAIIPLCRLTCAPEVELVQLGDGLVLEVEGEGALGEESQPRVPSQPSGQPGQVAVARERVIRNSPTKTIHVIIRES